MLVQTLLELVVQAVTAQEGIMIAILVSAAVTGGFSAWNIWQTRKAAQRQVKIDSSRILSDMMNTTLEFRPQIDHLLNDSVTKNDYDGLVRILTRFEVFALCWRDGLIEDEYVDVVYGGLLQKLTDEKIAEILQDDLPGIRAKDLQDKDAKIYHGLRNMRDELV